MSRSPSAAAGSREDLDRRRRDLNDQAATLKRRIRKDKEQLKSVATMRRELIEQYHQFGIEVVIVPAADHGQGVEATHGRQDEDQATREETNREEAAATGDDPRHTSTDTP